MRERRFDAWAVSTALVLVACGGATRHEDAASGGAGAGGTAGSGGSVSGGSGGSSACSCAPPLVCDGTDCVEALRLVSVAPTGEPGAGASRSPDISRDGHLIAFVSEAKDLGDPAFGEENVYTRYLPGSLTTLVSITGPTATLARSVQPSLSPNGEFLAFASTFSFFVTDQNQNFDVLVSDLHSLSPELVSTTASGQVQTGASQEPCLNEDSGRSVFSSTNGLVAEDDNSISDVYLSERGGEPGPVLLSVPSADAFPSSGSFSPAISAHGRFVAFTSSSPDPAGGDDDQTFDVFVRDLSTNALTRITPSTQTPDYFLLFSPRLSADGELVVFASQRPLVVEDVNERADIYGWERATVSLSLLSRAPDGTPGDGDSLAPSVSDDGRFVAFESRAQNLVPGDDNDGSDVFVLDRESGATALVSRGALPSNGASREARISGNGRFVAFSSEATNLSANDGNAASDVFVAKNPLAQ